MTSKAFLLYASLALTTSLQALPAGAWTKEGKWSTGYFKCGNLDIKLFVDMNRRIGGSEVVPIREAQLKVGRTVYPAVWMVGGDNNTAETNNREWRLVFWKQIVLTHSTDGSKRICSEPK